MPTVAEAEELKRSAVKTRDVMTRTPTNVDAVLLVPFALKNALTAFIEFCNASFKSFLPEVSLCPVSYFNIVLYARIRISDYL